MSSVFRHNHILYRICRICNKCIHGVSRIRYLLIYGAEPFLRSCHLCSPSRTPQHFMEPEGSSQSQSHITTDGQSVCLSSCRDPSGAHDQIFVHCLTVTVLSMGGRPLRREGGSVLCQHQSTVIVNCHLYINIQFSMITFFPIYNNTISTRHLSVRTRYSRLCPIFSSFRYHSSLRHLSGRMLDRRQV
jgi:hypothetical protein